MEKRGQFDISFGVIFGIIIIVAIIATAFYVLSHFLNLSRCTDTGLFYNDLQDSIDKAWAGSITNKPFTSTLPSNIQSVCLGSVSDGNPSEDSRTQYEDLARYRGLDKNVFLYPSNKACNSQLAAYKLNHIQVTSFFCAKVVNSKATLTISKSESDALVTLSK